MTVPHENEPYVNEAIDAAIDCYFELATATDDTKAMNASLALFVELVGRHDLNSAWTARDMCCAFWMRILDHESTWIPT